MNSREPKWIQRCMWLRFIPFKFHVLLPAIGFIIGQAIHDLLGASIGTVIGIVLGIPLQLLKYQCVKTATQSPNAIRGLDLGLDLDRGRNAFQLISGAVCAGFGAVAGGILTKEARLIGVAGGAILGFVAGVFLAGLTLLLAHYAKEFRTKILKRSRR